MPEAANQWSNHGPVNHLLQQHIHSELQLDNRRSVVTTCSCTAAMEALSHLVEHTIRKKPKWLISSFGFINSNRGSYRDSIILDCDESGFLDLSALKQVPLEAYDGIVVTNVFGLRRDLSDYVTFAKERDKYILIDNASGYGSIGQRGSYEKMFEAISFHHSKPYGFGEGGCAILSKTLENTFTRIINFGKHIDENRRKIGINGKMSDISAAVILQHLESSPQWIHCYKRQAKRIIKLAEEEELVLLHEIDIEKTVCGNIPLIFPKAIRFKDVQNSIVDLDKYYKPLAKTKVATKIFNRIVNFPCHPGLDRLTDNEIKNILRKVRLDD